MLLGSVLGIIVSWGLLGSSTLNWVGSVSLSLVEETLDSALDNAVDVADGLSNGILAAGAAVFHGACFTTWLVEVV